MMDLNWIAVSMLQFVVAVVVFLLSFKLKNNYNENN